MTPITFKQEAALKYYEIHVTARTTNFNVAIVITSATLVAYYTTISSEMSGLAATLAFLAGGSIGLLWAISETALKKIQRAESEIAKETNDSELWQKDDNNTRAKYWGLTNRWWKRGVYFLLIVTYLTAGVYALLSKPTSKSSTSFANCLKAAIIGDSQEFVEITAPHELFQKQQPELAKAINDYNERTKKISRISINFKKKQDYEKLIEECESLSAASH